MYFDWKVISLLSVTLLENLWITPDFFGYFDVFSGLGDNEL